MQAMVDAENAAKGLLDFMWADSDGAITLPIDPVQIAVNLGVRVFHADLPADMGASLVKKVGQDPVILLNQDDSKGRQRFSCAHELGHFVAHSGEEEFEYVENRSPLSSTGMNQAEVYANQFGAALLMPAHMVRKLHSDGHRLLYLARRFDVSTDAMSYRLKNLQLDAE